MVEIFDKAGKSRAERARDCKMMALVLFVALVITGRVVAMELSYHYGQLTDVVVASNLE